MPRWCDMMCPHAAWPKEDSLDGSGSCRTFIAVQCNKYNRLTAKNAPCLDRTLGAADKKKAMKKATSKTGGKAAKKATRKSARKAR